MAFDPKRFNQVARAGDWAMWVLQTTDAAAVVDAANYIAPAKSYAGLVKAGHIVFRLTYTDTTYSAITSWGIHVLKDVSATVIDLADELAGVVTDTRAAPAAAGVEPPPTPHRPGESEDAYKTRLDHEHKAWVEEDKKARAAAAAASAAEEREDKRTTTRR